MTSLTQMRYASRPARHGRSRRFASNQSRSLARRAARVRAGSRLMENTQGFRPWAKHAGPSGAKHSNVFAPEGPSVVSWAEAPWDGRLLGPGHHLAEDVA